MSHVLQFESLESLEDFLKNNEEGRSFLSKLISTTHIEQSKLNGLLINKDKILEEKKALQEKYKELEEKFINVEKKLDNNDEEDYIRLKEEEKKWIESASSNDTEKTVGDVAHSTEVSNLKLKLATAEKTNTKTAQQFELLLKEKDETINKITSSFEEVLISNALNEELDATNINPLHRKMLTKSFRGGASVELDGDGNRSVLMLNETDNVRLPIHDWFIGWAADESAKLYINPPSNSGGGSSSGKGFSKNDLEDLKKQYNEFQSTGQIAKAIAVRNRMKTITQQQK